MRYAVLCAFATILVAPKPADAQTKGQLYALGVQMGLASYQASVANSATTDIQLVKSARALASFSLRQAVSTANDINAAAKAFVVEDNDIRGMIGEYEINNPDDEWLRANVSREYQDIIVIRERITAHLAQSPSWSALVHGYVLGVNMGIAEGHASGGDAFRSRVATSLGNARNEAQALGLDLTALNTLISLNASTAATKEVYQQISSVRSTFQSSLP